MAQQLLNQAPAPESFWQQNRLLLQRVERLERELAHARHLACHDALTGLANRALALERLRQAMLQATRHRKMVVVLLLDLEGFKALNQRLGHHAGDLILRRVAGRLLGCLRSCDTACRYGGDEFVVLLTEVDHVTHARTVIRKIRTSLALLHQVGDRQISVRVNIGVAFHREGGCSCTDLIDMADAALYRARVGREAWPHRALAGPSFTGLPVLSGERRAGDNDGAEHLLRGCP